MSGFGLLLADRVSWMVMHKPDIARFCKCMVIVRDDKVMADAPVKDRRNANNE